MSAIGDKTPEAVPHAVADRHDDAVVYLEGHEDQSAYVDLRALRHKIDRRLMPYMFCCYVLQFLDKVMLNVSLAVPLALRTRPLTTDLQYAAVMGLKKDLKLVGNDFSNTATWFFIAYLIAEVPNGSFHPFPSPAPCLDLAFLAFLAGSLHLWKCPTIHRQRN